MQIQPLGSPSAQRPASSPLPPAPEGPTILDTWVQAHASALPLAGTHTPCPPQPPRELDPVEGMRAMRNLERIPKQEHRYEVLGHAASADGSLYLLYGESGTSAGYVARLKPDGGIDWEAPVDEPRCLGVDGQGGVHVAGLKGRVRLTAGGLAFDAAPAAKGWTPLWLDAASGGVAGLQREGLLVASPGVDVPSALQGRRIETTVVSPGGDSLRVGTKDGWGVLRAGGGSTFFPTPPEPVTSGVWTFTDDVHPLADGNVVYEIHRTVEIPMRPMFGGMLMPNHRGPREPGHDYDTRISLRRCATDGTTTWETPPLGRMLTVGVAADGSAWAAGESHGERGENTVWRVLPDGSVGGKADVSGPVHAVLAHGDEAFVSHARRISRSGHDGQVSPVPGSDGWRARAVVADGRLLVVDESRTRAALLDPRSGAILPVTDLETDHVLTRRDEIEMAMRRLPEAPEASPPPQIVVGDEWIVVGGMRIPRRRTQPAE